MGLFSLHKYWATRLPAPSPTLGRASGNGLSASALSAFTIFRVAHAFIVSVSCFLSVLNTRKLALLRDSSPTEEGSHNTCASCRGLFNEEWCISRTMLHLKKRYLLNL